MNWERHWSTPRFPIHGAPALATVSKGWSSGMLLGLGAAGVLAGAILGDAGLVVFMRGLGWKS
jgi:hypothetical protein